MLLFFLIEKNRSIYYFNVVSLPSPLTIKNALLDAVIETIDILY